MVRTRSLRSIAGLLAAIVLALPASGLAADRNGIELVPNEGCTALQVMKDGVLVAEIPAPGDGRCWSDLCVEYGICETVEVVKNAARAGVTVFDWVDILRDNYGASADGGLWMTDGTAAGTRKLRRVWGQSESQGPTCWYSWKLFGKAVMSWHGCADGRVIGAIQSFSLVDGSKWTLAVPSPRNLAVLGDRLYVSGVGPTTGREPWIANRQRVRLLADVNPGPAHSRPQSFTRVGRLVFFTAIHHDHGRELWATNGAAAWLVKDLVPGRFGSDPFLLEARDGLLWFRAYTESVPGYSDQWVSDGTAEGTVMVDPGGPRT